jgi:Fe-S-cluster containining protein
LKTTTTKQKICIQCGLCCDGTLFDRLKITPDENPERFVDLLHKNGEDRFMSLPCVYFNEKCTVYDEKKPTGCSTFECKILSKVDSKSIGFDGANSIINELKLLREEITHEYIEFYKESKSFRAIYNELDSKMKESTSPSIQLKSLYFKCGLLEAQLSKHLRTESKFKKLFEKID